MTPALLHGSAADAAEEDQEKRKDPRAQFLRHAEGWFLENLEYKSLHIPVCRSGAVELKKCGTTAKCLWMLMTQDEEICCVVLNGLFSHYYLFPIKI